MPTTRTRTRRPTTRAAALPPIPQHTLEGARLTGISETLRALDAIKGVQFALQDNELEQLADRLGVAAMFLAVVDAGSPILSDATVEAYQAWRQRLAAGKAGA